MPDGEVTLGITCPRCRTRNLLIVRDFGGEETIHFKCVECGFEKDFKHPDDTTEQRR
jgi:DNA-directed RNA polymerase subunit RPC12/RpoP